MTTSFSEVNTYMRCPQKHHYRYTEELENPRWWKPAMKLGTFYHALHEARAKGEGLKLLALTDEILSNPYLFDAEKDEQIELLGQAQALFERWKQRYPYDEEIVAAEETFETEYFSGTPDAVIDDGDGLLIRDYKTTSYMGLPLFDLQPYMYMWILHKLGHKVKGFEYDYIRTKEPVQPRLTAKGTVADIKRIDTTPAILLDFLLEHDLMWEPDHRDRYLELLKEEDKWFRKDFIPWDPKAAGRIELELMHWRAMMKTRPRGLSLQAYGMTACNRCQYTDICQAYLRGEDPDLEEYRVSED